MEELIKLIYKEPTEEVLIENKVKEDLQKAGIDITIFLADYHSWINRKLGRDLSTIRKVAGGYFKEALKQSLKIMSGSPDNVNYVLGSDLYKGWIRIS